MSTKKRKNYLTQEQSSKLTVWLTANKERIVKDLPNYGYGTLAVEAAKALGFGVTRSNIETCLGYAGIKVNFPPTNTRIEAVEERLNALEIKINRFLGVDKTPQNGEYVSRDSLIDAFNAKV